MSCQKGKILVQTKRECRKGAAVHLVLDGPDNVTSRVWLSICIQTTPWPESFEKGSKWIDSMLVSVDDRPAPHDPYIARAQEMKCTSSSCGCGRTDTGAYAFAKII